MRRQEIARAASLAALCACAVGLSGAEPVPPRHGHPEAVSSFDHRRPLPRRAVVDEARAGAAREHLRARVPGVEVDEDALLHTPKWIRSRRGFLTRPGEAEGPGRRPGGRGAERTIRWFLNEHAGVFGHDAGALDRARRTRDAVTEHNGLRTLMWQQEVDGVPVFDALVVGHVTVAGELVTMSAGFIPDPEAAATRGRRGGVAGRAQPDILASEAIVLAAGSLGERVAARAVGLVSAEPNEAGFTLYRAADLPGEAAVRRVWLPVDRLTLRLCWEVLVESGVWRRSFRVLIDGETGEAWLRQNLSSHLSEASYRVFTSDSPTPMSPGHDVPKTNQPPWVGREMVTLAALSTNASPLGWISDDVNETRGNNVEAQLDRDGNNQPDLPRPQGSPARTFDIPIDLLQTPDVNRQAAVVQVFYWCNWMHDTLYDLGFTEAYGNFQTDNFGRGGLGGDAVQADVQDLYLVNNSRFDTPEDGLPGRMEVGIFTHADPDRDSSFDAEVVLHEYTHGLTERLLPGAASLENIQSRGMAEGWSDFYPLALLSEAEDDVDGNYAIGAYVSYRGAGSQNYYFGIRRYPYATDTQKNPLTFKDIDPTQASTHPGITNNPVVRTPPGDRYSVGEVWCVMLWEVRANLIRKHGFEAGNRLMLQLVTDGLKLAPGNPNFVQARDAILTAEQVNGNTNYFAIWAGFAKRGLGLSAACPPSNALSPVVEAFDVPDTLEIFPRTGFTSSGPVDGPFGPSQQTYALTNIGTGNLSWAASHTNVWLSLSLTNGDLVSGGAGAAVTVSVNTAAQTLPAGIYSDAVIFTNLTTGVSQVLPFTLRVGQPDSFTEVFAAGDNDLAYNTFTFTPDGSISHYSVCREVATRFPTDPTGGIPVSLADDAAAQVTVTGGQAVTLYGTEVTAFFIGSNGYLTFGEGDTTRDETLGAHYDRPRISALFDDLDPSRGGTVSWKQLSNRVAVTFLNVPEYQAASSNSFQVEMFFDGTLRLTYLGLAARDGLVGLSPGGGVPASYFESDFSAYADCSEPLAVELPVQATEGDGLLAQQGRVILPRELASNLVVRLTSSDPDELATPETVTVVAGATRATFNLWVVDDGVLDGSQAVTVQATAAGIRKGTNTMIIHDNEFATLRVVLPASASEGIGLQSGRVEVSAPPAKPVWVSLSTSYTDEIEVPPMVLLPAGQTSAVFTITVIDDEVIDGSSAVEVTARVMNWVEGSGTITIHDNEDTFLRLTLPSQVHEDDGVLPNAGLVRIAGVLHTNLPVTLASDRPANLGVPAVVWIAAGQTSATFDLAVQDNGLTNATLNVTVQASAAGFQGTSAQIAVLDDEVPDTPKEPKPPHLATNIPIYRNLAWAVPDRDLIVNGGFEAGTFAGWTRESSGAGDFYVNDGTFDPTSPDGSLPPLAGEYSAVSSQTGPSWRILQQEITIPSGAGPVELRWAQRLRNFAAAYGPEQQFRVELRNPADAVLAVAYVTPVGEPLLGDWTTNSYDLALFKGQTIRVAFIAEDSEDFLNVHLDNISVLVPPDNLTEFDVYFGLGPELGAEDFLGSTTNRFWDLPLLAPLTTYYWQVVARRLGEIPSPVWRFTTWQPSALEVAPVASPQVQHAPVALKVTARDLYQNVVSNFTGPVTFSARVEVPDVVIDETTGTSPFPLAASGHDARAQYLYPADELGGAQRFTALGLEVISAPGQVLTNWTIRMQHTPATEYIAAEWAGDNWTVVYQANEAIVDETWVVFEFETPFDYVGTSSLLIDFSFNNSSASFDGWCRVTDTYVPRGAVLQSNNHLGDPLAWSGAVPAPALTSEVPGLRLTPYKPPVAITPERSGAFLDGTWTGYIRIPVAGTNVSVGCTVDPTLIGYSNPFDLSADSDGDGMPDIWENAHGLDPEDSFDGELDLDLDGVVNRDEFLANTDPHDALSCLRILSIRRNSPVVRLVISTAPDRSYRLERASDLTGPGAWIDLGGWITGTGAPVEYVDEGLEENVTYFYRVRVVR